MGLLHRLDRLIAGVIAAAQWLALPLILLLFLQWPLRDLVQCCSRQANDLGQIIFALLVAVSVTAATAPAHISPLIHLHNIIRRVPVTGCGKFAQLSHCCRGRYS